MKIAVATVCLWSTLLSIIPIAAAENQKRNILFIGFDDLRTELGCYGAQYMKTPHIDALARRGLVLEKAYCQQAICAASRSSLLTGLRPDTTGIYDLDHPLNQTLPDAMSMPRFFKSHGYRTVSLGKIYHHATDDKAYWDVLNRCDREAYSDPKTQQMMLEKRTEARGKGLTAKELRNNAKGPAYEVGQVEDGVYADGAIADAAIEQLQRKDTKPFFMAIGFKKPHLPFVAPKKYWDMYDRTSIAIPSRANPIDAPDSAFTNWGELRAYHGMPSQGDCSDEETRTLIHAYRACVSYVDAQLGRILAELDRQGLRDNTMIVLWGDHGWKLGEYGDWCKHTNFELDTHVPLIWSGPGVPTGTRSSALVEYIDIYPTLAESCGLEAPKQCEGRSMSPLFSNPTQEWKQAAYSQYPRNGGMGYTVRSRQWRYTEWRKRNGDVLARELYDHSQTDRAVANVANNPEFSTTLKEMQVLLGQLKP